MLSTRALSHVIVIELGTRPHHEKHTCSWAHIVVIALVMVMALHTLRKNDKHPP